MDHMSGKLIAECSVASEFRLDTNSVRDVAKKKKKKESKAAGSYQISMGCVISVCYVLHPQNNLMNRHPGVVVLG